MRIPRRNASERILFRHLYETLVRIDCAGRILPGLAERWEPRRGGRAFRFTLRAEARFWDGSRVTAQDIVASWAAAASEDGLAYTHRPLAARTPPSVAAAVAVSDRVLEVSLTEPHAAGAGRARGAAGFAHPALAVMKPSAGSTWPLGTGPHRVGGVTAQPTERGLSWVLTALPMQPGTRPVIRFRLEPGADPRDLLDPFPAFHPFVDQNMCETA